MADYGENVVLRVRAATESALADLNAFVDVASAALAKLRAGGIDVTEAQQALASLQAKVEEVRSALEVKIPVEVETGPAVAQVEALERDLRVGLLTAVQEVGTSAAPSMGALSDAITIVSTAVAALVEETAVGGTEMATDLREAGAIGARALESIGAGGERAGVAVREGAQQAATGAGGLTKALESAELAMQNLLERVTLGSRVLGSGLPTALLRAEGAIAAYAGEVERLKEDGDPVTPEAVEDLARLEAEYGAATEAAQRLTARQAELRAELRQTQDAAQEAGNTVVAAAEESSAAMAGLAETVEVAGTAAQEELGAMAGAAERAGKAVDEAGIRGAEGTLALVRALEGADRAVTDLAERTTAGSESFGKALPAAVVRAEAALIALQQAIASLKAQGAPIPPGAVASVVSLNATFIAGVQAAQAYANRLAAVKGQMGAVQGGTPGLVAGFAQIGNGLSRLLFGFEAFVAIQAGRKLVELGKDSVDAANYMQQLSLTLSAATGSAAAGAREQQFLVSTTDRLGIGVRGVSGEYVKLIDVAKAAGMSLDNVREITSRVLEVSRELNLGEQKTSQIFELLREVIDRGSISMAQMRRRLGEELPGAMEALQKVTGKTGAELEKLMKDGELSSAVLLPLVSELSRQYSSALAPALGSAQAEMDRFENASLKAKAALGEALLPAVAEAARSLTDFLTENRDGLSALGETSVTAFKVVGDSIRSVIPLMQFFTLELQGIHDKSLIQSGAVKDLALAWNFFGEREAEAARKTEETRQKLAEQIVQTVRLAEETAKSGTITAATASRVAAAINLALSAYRNADPEFKQLFARRALELETWEAKIKGSAVVLTEALSDQIASTRRYASDFEDELKRTGIVSAAAADKIVKEIKAELLAIDQLPPAERKSFEERRASLVALQAEFEKFTTEYQKLMAKQEKAAESAEQKEAKSLDQREQAWIKFFKSVQELSDKAISKQDSEQQKGLQGDLASAQKELSGLKAKPLNSVDDLNRMDELQRKINQTTDALRKAGDQAKATGGQEAASAEQASQTYERLRDTIFSALSDQDKLGADFNKLGPEAQAAFQQMTQGLLDSAKAGKLSQQQVSDYASSVAALFQQAGIAASDFANRVRSATDPTRSLGQALDAVREEGAKGSAALSDAAAKLQAHTSATAADTGALKQNAAAAESATQAQTGVAEATQEAAAGVRIQSDAFLDGQAGTISYTDGQGNVKTVVIDVAKASDAAATSIDNFSNVQSGGAQKAEDLAAQVEQLRHRTDDLKTSTDEAKEGEEDFSNVISGNSTISNQLGAALQKAATQATAVATATTSVGTAAATASPALDKMGTAADKVGSSGAGAEMQREGAAAVQVASSLPAATKALDAFSDSLDKVGKAVDTFVRKLGQLDGAISSDLKLLAQWVQLEKDAAVACKALTDCLNNQAAQ